MENVYYPESGDIIKTKSGKERCILRVSNSIEQGVDDTLPTMEEILVVAPITRTPPFFGVILPATKWTGNKLVSVDVFNREYLFVGEVESEVGYIYSEKIIKELSESIDSKHLNCKNPSDNRKAIEVCKTSLEKNRFQSTLHVENPSSDKIQ